MMGIVRMQPLDPAFTADGHRDVCAYCGNLGAGDKTYMCDGCDDVYHYKCSAKPALESPWPIAPPHRSGAQIPHVMLTVPNGIAKPRKGCDWFCPNTRCQGRERRRLQSRVRHRHWALVLPERSTVHLGHVYGSVALSLLYTNTPSLGSREVAWDFSSQVT